MDDADPQELPLREALIRWCDGALVEQVRARERQFTATDLAGFHYARLVPDAEMRQPSRQEWMIGTPDLGPLISAWEELERDWGDRLRRGEFHLQGVQTKPERTIAPRPIPGAWAADCLFDFTNNTVTIDDQRFVAVIASRAPLLTVLPEVVPQGRRLGEITPLTVRDLTDDEVMLLLEEHARRVVEDPDAALFPANKISFMPIIKRKMRHRHAQGELLPTLVAEAQALADWIAIKVPSHQCPAASAIENAMRIEYWTLNPRSKAMIP